MERPIFILTIGLPASGKSSWAEQKAKEINAEIYSSDQIRQELGDINDQSKNAEVFDILHRRTRQTLKEKKNVIADATFLSRKNRMSLLKFIQKVDCYKECVLFAVPYEICMKRNMERDRIVPEDAMKKLLKQFDPPCKQEGWDNISIIWNDEIRHDFLKDWEMWDKISHDNPHHTLTIGKHLEKANNYYNENDIGRELSFAILMHDCGKPFCKEFKDSKGNESKTAHFYEHHKVGCYFSLFYLHDLFYDNFPNFLIPFTDEEILYISLLINLHMRPFMAYHSSSKAEQKDRHLFGDKIIDDVMLLHQADVYAH